MHRRRRFLTQIPLGFASLVAACKARGGEQTTAAPAPAAGSNGVTTTKPAPLFFENALREYIADYDLDEEQAESDGDVEDAETE